MLTFWGDCDVTSGLDHLVGIREGLVLDECWTVELQVQPRFRNT